MEGLRRTFGMAEPIRRGMELKIAARRRVETCCAGKQRPWCP